MDAVAGEGLIKPKKALPLGQQSPTQPIGMMMDTSVATVDAVVVAIPIPWGALLDPRSWPLGQ